MAEYSKQYMEQYGMGIKHDFCILEEAKKLQNGMYTSVICEGYGFVGIGKDEEGNIILATPIEGTDKVEWKPYNCVVGIFHKVETKVFDVGVKHNGLTVLTENIKWEHQTPLTFDFNQERVIGHAHITRTDKELNAELYLGVQDIPKDVPFYPAITIKFDPEKNIGNLITDATVYEVSLCGTPNTDETIKPIIF